MYPRLVILSRGPRLYSTRRLAEEAQKAGWAVRIIDPLSLTVVVDEKGDVFSTEDGLSNVKRSFLELDTRLLDEV